MIKLKNWIGLLLASLAACGPARRDDAAPRTVVLLSIDGLPAGLLDDPRAPAPTLKRLAREGASARAMTVANPAITWPNHATLATGVPPARHGVLFNGLLVRPGPKAPVRVQACGRDLLVRVPTVYDRAHDAGLRTAQVDWIPWQTGGTIDWSFEERPSPGGPIERSLVAAGVLSEKDVEDFNAKTNAPWRDVVWTRAAIHILEEKRPNLLLLHLLNLDNTHHKYGPGTLAGQNALALADARVAEVVAALGEGSTLVVVSDHGFKAVKKNIRPHVAFKREGLLKADGAKILECDACFFPEGGSAMVYVTDPSRRAELLPRVREICRKLEGVDRVVEPSEYAALGLPDPKDNEQMADLVLMGKPDYAFGSSPEGDAAVVEATGELSLGHHGYPSSDPDMDAVFIAWGAGIRPGARLDRISNTDVAPTVAALLGLRLENVSGRVLREFLR